MSVVVRGIWNLLVSRQWSNRLPIRGPIQGQCARIGFAAAQQFHFEARAVAAMQGVIVLNHLAVWRSS